MTRRTALSFEALRQQALLDAIRGADDESSGSWLSDAKASLRSPSDAPDAPLKLPGLPAAPKGQLPLAAVLQPLPDGPSSARALLATARVAGPPARIASGLDAYRGTAEAAAERALTATFPTVAAMVGESDFGRLARAYLHDDAPRDGDLGEWGAGFAPWLARQPLSAEWPCLGDCAALDHAMHRCERAADAVFDAASLTLLESADPAHLQIRLRPGSAVLQSAWPIATIHAAHRDAAPDVEAVRAALAARRAEQVLVVRSGWRAALRPIDAPTADFTRSLLDGTDLAAALDRAGPSFDFTVWLADALRGGWLQGVACSAD